MTVRLRGISWDHRRAIDPLTRTMPLFREHHPDIEIAWTARPLSGFEFTSVDALAADYDLIILDHPFMGEVAASRSLAALDNIAGLLDDLFVGPSLATYRMNGSIWALPVDAACQVGVSRPDLMRKLEAQPPKDWSGVTALGARARRHGMHLAIGLAGVHSLMTFFTLMANLGAPCVLAPDRSAVDERAAREALGMMRELLDYCPSEVLDWNSIALHDKMAAHEDLVFCPAVYCYATYAEADHRRPLRFHDLPGPYGHSGSTVGGTGLAVSAKSKHRQAALDYVRFASQASTQLAFARHHGQPARREAWLDKEVNERFGGAYSDTLPTMEAAWTRPRYAGYLSFQERAGDQIVAHLRGDVSEDALLTRLRLLHLESAEPA